MFVTMDLPLSSATGDRPEIVKFFYYLGLIVDMHGNLAAGFLPVNSELATGQWLALAVTGLFCFVVFYFIFR